MSEPAPLWLLELTINGRIERFATRSSIVVDDDGVDRQFREGLAELSFTLAAIEAGGEISVPITIDAEALENVRLERDDLVAGGWAALVAALHEVEGAEGVLYRWTPGTTLGEARVMLRGFAEEVEHGGRLEPLVFTLRRLLFSGSRPVLDPQARVDASTWPISASSNRQTDEKIIGQSYARIYGYPGRSDTALPIVGFQPSPVVPGLLADYRDPGGGPGYLVIADGPVEATAVHVWDFDGDTPTLDIIDVIELDDELGRTVSAVDLDSPSSSLSGDPGHPYYVAFSETYGGGRLRRDRSGILRGLGEIIGDLLEQNARLDVVEIDPRLDAWKIDTFTNEPGVDAWDWISREFGPLAPFRLFEGRLGLSVRLMDWQAVPADAVARFDVDLGQLDRISTRRSTASSNTANRIIVEYRPDRQNGAFADLVGLDADSDPTDPRIVGSLRCAESQRRLSRSESRDDGVRELVIQTSHLWDRATARLVANYIAAERALPLGLVEYRGEPGLEQRLDPTDPIIVNDTEIGLLDRVALVESLTVSANETLLSLLVLPSPATVRRATL